MEEQKREAEEAGEVEEVEEEEEEEEVDEMVGKMVLEKRGMATDTYAIFKCQ